MDLYAENILDHFQNPRNKGRLESATASVDDANPLCGDTLHLELEINPKNSTIQKVAFEGSGCAISQSAMSMLTELLPGKTREEAEKISKDDMYTLIGVPLSPARVKCALLALTTLKKALIHLKRNL